MTKSQLLAKLKKNAAVIKAGEEGWIERGQLLADGRAIGISAVDLAEACGKSVAAVNLALRTHAERQAKAKKTTRKTKRAA